MEEVIEGGPWLYLGQPIVLQKWEPGMVLRKLKHTEVPVWIKLRHLPVELWTTEGLSTVASGIGRPLYPDAITRACTRLDFARVCVMLNVSSKLPKRTWRRDHQVAVKELVNEFRLNFLGLLETRVSAVNVLRVQTFLPRWSWFTDYDLPGNRIWIAWDDDLLDVDVLNLDVQLYTVALIFVVLTLVDMSEVCGASADIHLAMNEFRDCILGTGLIHLPVQENSFLGIIAVKEIVAYGNVWIDYWLMMLGYDCGRIRIINVLTLGLPITPHLCSEEILIIIR
ncbi:hypothetical protein Sango_2979200 [Sesamum angolense]|uniref:DUF4283 domain-containing protein n=1 Tax=Sesamum angolense TaxID=2727404 RepID=A0AAE1VTC4_9LAMI|nr:hypothetical protein Sango_2979200 [Sesamum angolense]